VGGYSDKIGKLTERLFEAMKLMKIVESRFILFKQKVKK
jgi:hypothetical protein